jgi:DNA topoisomerase VI subunit B
MTTHILTRTVFKTSRLLEFCSQKELVNQTGHAVAEWPLVILKELIDNSLDACEEAGIAPVIMISVQGGHIVVADNGPGIEPQTVADVLDYNFRVSSREAYCSPTRGAQGNALKTILAMGYALTGSRGDTVIESMGTSHTIGFRADQIKQEPRIDRVCGSSLIRNGTRITVQWPVSSSSILENAKSRFLQIAEDFAWLNPHLSLNADWNGERGIKIGASDPSRTKWRPRDPTSAFWYDSARLVRLMAAHLNRDEDNGRCGRTVREFIDEFRGLSGSAKQKALLNKIGASRMSLRDFLGSGDHLNTDAIDNLLAAMRQHSRPVAPKDLGIIGREFLTACLRAVGTVDATLRYKLTPVEVDGLPYLIECAFAWLPEGANRLGRRIIRGLNWSPAINDPFRSLEWGRGLESILADLRAGADEPIAVVLHVACPRFSITDRGKTAIALDPAVASHIVDLIKHVTKPWTKQRKAEERHESARVNRLDRLIRLIRPKRETIKDVAYRVMEHAYLKASDDGVLPANARQIMYAARPEILRCTGRKEFDDAYFTQTLLPNYIEENADQCRNWDIVFDDRGHFTEPHTGRYIGLGRSTSVTT